MSIRVQSTQRDRSDGVRSAGRPHGTRRHDTGRPRLIGWIVAGAIGLTAAGAVQPAGPAIAAEPAARAATITATSVAVRSRPVYTVHQILPNAPANAVALTLDDGPDPVWTPRVLALLRRYNVRATFCLVGAHARAHPNLVRQIVAGGHAICNHSMTHPQPFAHRSAAAIEQQINGAQSAITSAAGTAPRLFRAPGGDWSPAVFAAAARRGLTPIGWDVDPRDWSRPGTQKIINTLLAARPGDILLCHDADGVRPSTSSADRSETFQALQTALPRLKAKGYTFVTL